MLYGIYRALSTIILFLPLPLLPLVCLLDRRRASDFVERLARYPSRPSRPASSRGRKKTVWIHAASVGEVRAATVLINELSGSGGDVACVLTAMTRQGREIARSILPGDVTCLLAPLDVPLIVRRAINEIKPDVYICLETELWPAMLTEADRAGVKMLLLNGRMSERSLRRYSLVAGFMGKLLSGFSELAMISEADAARFKALGVSGARIRVTGNLKYDLPPGDRRRMRRHYRQMLHIGEETVFICGSTRGGEEELLARAYQRLCERSGRKIIWLVAPRHLERLPEVESLFKRLELRYDLFTALRVSPRRSEVILLDCMGELADLYALGDFNFCGGSLVDKGGHNIMEAARWGGPVYFGPSMRDFRDAVEMVKPAGAGFQVESAEALADLILEHMKDETKYEKACRAAGELALNHGGAAARQAGMALRLLALDASVLE